MSRAIVRFAVASFVLVPLAASGCAKASDEVSPCFRPLPSITPLSEPAYTQVPDGKANVTMFVSNVVNQPIRVTIRFNEDVVFDSRMPAAPFGCSTEPIYSYRYRLPRGHVQVRADSSDGETKSANLRIGSREKFVTVMSQRGFPLYLKMTLKKPVFG